jgi:hypothetical protein
MMTWNDSKPERFAILLVIATVVGGASLMAGAAIWLLLMTSHVERFTRYIGPRTATTLRQGYCARRLLFVISSDRDGTVTSQSRISWAATRSALEI